MSLKISDSKSIKASKDSNGHILGVITARGGSKRLPGKNIIPLAGRPLLSYIAEVASHAVRLERVILSTDSEDIAKVGRACGVKVPFLRPQDLATDTATSASVVDHACWFLEDQGYQVEIVVTLQPTSPLCKPEHIDQAVEHLLSHPEMDSVITVVETTPPEFIFSADKNGMLVPSRAAISGFDYSIKRRQEFPSYYRSNGAVYVTRRSLLKDRGILYSPYIGGNCGYVVMDAISSIDIDTWEDLELARAAIA